jgi:uncharacterized protein YlxP (DUF503 family)
MGASGTYAWAVPAYVCVAEIRLNLPHVTSLKEKRRVVKSLAAQLRQRFGAAVAETEEQDSWHQAVLVAALVGGADTSARMDDLERFVDARSPDGCAFARELRTLADLRG